MSTAAIPTIHIHGPSKKDVCHESHKDFFKLEKILNDNNTHKETLKNNIKGLEPLVYKKFKINYSRQSNKLLQKKQKRFFVPNVSFDTVPINGISGTYSGGQQPLSMDYTEEEYYDNESHDVSVSSSTASYGDTTKNPQMDGLSHKSFFIDKDGTIHRSDYPSRPCIKNSALVISKSHKKYEKYWELENFKEKTVAKQRIYRDIIARPAPLAPVLNTYEEEAKRRKLLLKQLKQNGGDTNDAMTRKLTKINKTGSGFVAGPRSILIHISGRKHTWVTLDYALRNIVNNGDHIVIVTNLPPLTPAQKKKLEVKLKARMVARSNRKKRERALKLERGLSPPKSPRQTQNNNGSTTGKPPNTVNSFRKTTRGRAAHITDSKGHSYYEFSDGVVFSDSDTDMFSEGDSDFSDFDAKDHDDADDDAFDDEWSEGYSFQNIRTSLDDVMKYVMFVLPDDKIVKITIELSIGSLRKTFANALNCYFPKLVLTSSNKYKNNESLMVWKRKDLSDVLVNHYPVPAVVVPSRKLDYFEFELLKNLNRQEKDWQRSEQGGVNDIPSLSFSSLSSTSTKTTKSNKKDTRIRPPLPFMKTYSLDDLRALNLKVDHQEDKEEEGDKEDGKNLTDEDRSSGSDMESVDSHIVSSSDEDSESNGSIYDDNVLSKHDEKISGQPLVSKTSVCKLEHLLQQSKTQLDEKLLQLDQDNSLAANDKTLQRIDCILEQSLSFNAELAMIKPHDTETHFTDLQKVITGGKSPNSGRASKSMLDTSTNNLTKVSTYSVPSMQKKRKQFTNSIPPQLGGLSPNTGARPVNPTIRFAETPRKPQTLSPMRSNASSVSEDAPLRKVKSSVARLTASKSNDSSKSSLTSSLSNSGTSSSSTKKKKKSFFKSLFGKLSKD